MRLLEYDQDDKIRLTKDLLIRIPPYAILSHTWGHDDDEVTYRDMMDGTGRDKAGYKKLTFCAKKAKRHGLRYFWVDTCCINKSDAIEIQKSINSMFLWYKNAARCYVYLSDIVITSHERGQLSKINWESCFQTHRWFTRGWTLQELLAPTLVEFYSQDGELLGDKRSLERLIHEITGIAVQALRDNDFSHFDVEERFRWAENRETKHEEDWAYSLLGIFGVFMVPNYGEGKDYAVRRLRKEINEALNEHIPQSPSAERIQRRAMTDEADSSLIWLLDPNNPGSWRQLRSPNITSDLDLIIAIDYGISFTSRFTILTR
jgi:hypothetical protein